jgi:Ca2+-binding RTX toxin-like protein
MALQISDISAVSDSGKLLTTNRGNDYTYYIHNSDTYERVGDYNYHTTAHWSDEINFIDDIFKELDIAVEPDFRRVYNKDEAFLEIYRTSDLIDGHSQTLGLSIATYTESPTQVIVISSEIIWKPNYYLIGSRFIDEYGILRDNNANTLLHEIAHAMGLSHSQWDPWNEEYDTLDTIMSYNNVHPLSVGGWQSKVPLLTKLDVQAIRASIGIESSSVFFQGEGYDDVLYGSSESDTIYGGGGNDVIDGGGAEPIADYLYGESGNDELIGYRGADLLNGGSGNDILRAGNGRDIIDGGDGADLMYGGFGLNTFKDERDGSVDNLYIRSDQWEENWIYGKAGNSANGEKADKIEALDEFDKIYFEGISDSQLSYGSVNHVSQLGETLSGLGIYASGVLEAVYVGGNLNLNQLNSMTQGIL